MAGVSRRGFLIGLCSFFATNAMAASTRKEGTKPPSPQPKQGIGKQISSPQKFEDILVQAYLPTLKLNEGKLLHFQRKSEAEISVGYGSNVLAMPSLLDHVTVFHNGKALSGTEQRAFVTHLKTTDDADLKTYTILPADAEKMALAYSRVSVQNLQEALGFSKSGKSFFDMPLCMQALALDLYYNLPPAKFKKYKNFRAALIQGDYARAVRESLVYANVEKRIVNVERERRKERLYDVMQIVQDQPDAPLSRLNEAVEAVYRAKTPALTQKLIAQKDLAALRALVNGSVQWAALRHTNGLNKTLRMAKSNQVAGR